MAIRKINGHAVTGVFPVNSSDHTTVAPASLKKSEAPGNQSGGKGGPRANKGESTRGKRY